MDETKKGSTEMQEPTIEPRNQASPPPALQPPATRKPLLIAAGVILLAMFAASQVFLVTSLRTSETEIRAEFEARLTALDVSIADLSERIDTPPTPPNAPTAEINPSGLEPTPAEPAGFLPRFTGQGPDQAVGMKLATIEGFDAYTDEAVTIDPTDGTKRIWMAWAHWCPFCQQELPIVNAWWPGAAAKYPTVELITITTSIDPARGNPLGPYLEAQQFTFPVITDSDTKIAAQMGLNAFPFWMVTAGDGTVLYRTAGMLPIDQIEDIFAHLEELDA